MSGEEELSSKIDVKYSLAPGMHNTLISIDEVMEFSDNS